jgi:hypothetical protein
MEVKIKTYNSITLKVTIEESNIELKVNETHEVNQGFSFNTKKVKRYSNPPVKQKKVWFPRPSLSDVLLGATISTLLGFGVQYMWL